MAQTTSATYVGSISCLEKANGYFFQSLDVSRLSCKAGGVSIKAIFSRDDQGHETLTFQSEGLEIASFGRFADRFVAETPNGVNIYPVEEGLVPLQYGFALPPGVSKLFCRPPTDQESKNYLLAGTGQKAYAVQTGLTAYGPAENSGEFVRLELYGKPWFAAQASREMDGKFPKKITFFESEPKPVELGGGYWNGDAAVSSTAKWTLLSVQSSPKRLSHEAFTKGLQVTVFQGNVGYVSTSPPGKDIWKDYEVQEKLHAKLASRQEPTSTPALPALSTVVVATGGIVVALVISAMTWFFRR
ncbi:hypothetical protein MCEMSE15_00891 [Fimbriimonadaceae bacterium]